MLDFLLDFLLFLDTSRRERAVEAATARIRALSLCDSPSRAVFAALLSESLSRAVFVMMILSRVAGSLGPAELERLSLGLGNAWRSERLTTRGSGR